MGTHELEHLRLLWRKLTEVAILLLSIWMEVLGKCAHFLLMVKLHLLNIKRDGVKTLREILEGAGIVE